MYSQYSSVPGYRYSVSAPDVGIGLSIWSSAGLFTCAFSSLHGDDDMTTLQVYVVVAVNIISSLILLVPEFPSAFSMFEDAKCFAIVCFHQFYTFVSIVFATSYVTTGIVSVPILLPHEWS